MSVTNEESGCEFDNIYESGKTTRYHANPVMNVHMQTDADHAWGVTALLVKLFPMCSRNAIIYAIFHDSGERWAGDLPYPVKLANPKMAKEHNALEDALAAAKGIPQVRLSETEKAQVKLCDRLESVYFAKLKNPEMLRSDGFISQEKAIEKAAKELGVWPTVKKLLDKARPERTMNSRRRVWWRKIFMKVTRAGT